LEPGPVTDRLSYPPPGEVFELVGPPGTEFVLVCIGRGGPIRRAEGAANLDAGHPWPALPGRAPLTGGRDGGREEAPRPERGLGATRPGLLAGIRPPLERLHANLRGRVAFLAGVAFAHVDQAEPEWTTRPTWQTPLDPPADSP